jgi:hypothetical protein
LPTVVSSFHGTSVMSSNGTPFSINAIRTLRANGLGVALMSFNMANSSHSNGRETAFLRIRVSGPCFYPAGCELTNMSTRTALFGIALVCALTAPALAAPYPVDGKWGESTSTEKGAIDCSGKRVIGFNGEQRTDSKGGVPAYRNKSITPSGDSYRIVDEFTTGQISNGRTTYDLKQVDADRLEMTQQGGPLLKLQRCK